MNVRLGYEAKYQPLYLNKNKQLSNEPQLGSDRFSHQSSCSPGGILSSMIRAASVTVSLLRTPSFPNDTVGRSCVQEKNSRLFQESPGVLAIHHSPTPTTTSTYNYYEIETLINRWLEKLLVPFQTVQDIQYQKHIESQWSYIADIQFKPLMYHVFGTRMYPEELPK